MKPTKQDPPYPGAWHLFNKGEHNPDFDIMWQAVQSAMLRAGCDVMVESAVPMANRPVGLHIKYDNKVLLIEYACIPGSPFGPTDRSNLRRHYCTTNGATDWEKFRDIHNALLSDLQGLRNYGIRKDRYGWIVRKHSHDRTPLEVFY